MFDSPTNSAILIALLPVFAVVGISLNLFIRARGGRSFNLRLKGFGIDLTIESGLDRRGASTNEAPAKGETNGER